MAVSCNSMLRELEQLWIEIGENEINKNRMLSELERECLQVYRKKVDEVTNDRAQLHQSITLKEAEFATLRASLGYVSVNTPQIQLNKRQSSLKEQLECISQLVEDLKLKKDERMKQFVAIKSQIDKIQGELSGYGHHISSSLSSMNLEEENDFSVRKLYEYQSYLHSLQKDKSERLQRILDLVNEVHSLCGVLGLDFSITVSEIDPSLQSCTGRKMCDTTLEGLEKSSNICDTTLEGLQQAVVRLKTERKVRLQKLRDAASSLLNLWNLMDTNQEERSNYSRIGSILAWENESEIMDQGALSMEIIQQTCAEVEHQSKLKASRMKEIVMKRRQELEDICTNAHIQPDPSTATDKANAMIDSGLVDPCELLSNVEMQINKAKDEVSSRKEIMDRLERWLFACEEENWLQHYTQDANRYAAGRGGHVNLKRAERARIMVNKIPAMVQSLISKTLAWEDEKKKMFLYDGVRLISIMEDYKIARKQKEDDKMRARDQKKLQDLLLAEKESRFGSKPSLRSSSFRSVNGYCGNGINSGSVTPSARRVSGVGSATPQLLTPRSCSGRHNDYFKETRRLSATSLHFVAAIPQKELETISFSSICGSEPESPPQC